MKNKIKKILNKLNTSSFLVSTEVNIYILIKNQILKIIF